MKFFSPTLVAASLLLSAQVHAQTQIGFQAELSNLSTVGVSGTVEIIGPTTLRFFNFNYDGRGGGLTELTLLPDIDSATLLNRNIFGIPNGQRVDQFGSLVLADPDVNPGVPPVEFDFGVPLATLRQGASPTDPVLGPDAAPFVNFSGDFDFSTLGGSGPSFGDGGESITDFAGLSLFCIPFGVDFGSGIFTAPADFTNDGEVSIADFSLFRDSAGAEIPDSISAPPQFPFPFVNNPFDTPGELGDADLDGRVTASDFQLFLQQFGTLAASASPNTAAALAAFEQSHSAAPEGALEELLASFTAEQLAIPEGGTGPFAPIREERLVTSTAPAVPEPSAAVLVLSGLLASAGQRRR